MLSEATTSSWSGSLDWRKKIKQSWLQDHSKPQNKLQQSCWLQWRITPRHRWSPTILLILLTQSSTSRLSLARKPLWLGKIERVLKRFKVPSTELSGWISSQLRFTSSPCSMPRKKSPRSCPKPANSAKSQYLLMLMMIAGSMARLTFFAPSARRQRSRGSSSCVRSASFLTRRRVPIPTRTWWRSTPMLDSALPKSKKL